MSALKGAVASGAFGRVALFFLFAFAFALANRLQFYLIGDKEICCSGKWAVNEQSDVIAIEARPADSYWVLYCIYNTFKYWVYPILTMVIVFFPIQYNTIIFLKKIVKFLGRSNRQVKNKSREE